MKCFLHRIGKHIEWSHPLLEHKNLLSIGWADIAVLPDFISGHQNDWTKVPETVAEYCQKQGDVTSRSRFALQRFLEMDTGDQVIVPTWGAFHIYEIENDERLVPKQIEDDLKGLESWYGNRATINKEHRITVVEDEEQQIDLGFFRRVKCIERQIPRDGFADAALTSRMKVRQTNVEITDLRDKIKDAHNRYKDKRPINLRYQLLKKCESGVQETIWEMLNNDEFENLIAKYFEQRGAITDKPAKNKPGKGDADIIATFESLKLIVYVQAKRHEGETDSWAVDQIQQYVDGKNGSGADDEYTKILWVVSNAKEFSEDCKEKAKRDGSGKGVRLIDGIEFAQMLLDTGFEHLDES